ncbi:transcriptional repressor LexA [Candidatus Falkowbacteria bacterium]|nr:transcriptional repressor LexA [Candidatus Falkowbacteria bacterium]
MSLTKRQKEILDFINQYTEENGYAPSYREIAKKLGLSSVSTVCEHIQALESKGYLKMEPNEARSIEVIDEDFSKALNLPLLGLITAGQPIEAVEQKEKISVPIDLVKDSAKAYVLKVKGESMIEEGIYDGDFVVVEENPSPKDGQVVVALIDNTMATLKKFYKEANRIRLQPANSSMKPIFAKNVLVQGIVKAVIRKYSYV